MRVSFDTDNVRAIAASRVTGWDSIYAGTADGMDFYLHVPGFSIEFASPEEAEVIAGAILSGLRQAGLPRRGLPSSDG